MTAYAVTGTSRLRTPGEITRAYETVQSVIPHLRPEPSTLYFGGAEGIDTIALHMAIRFWRPMCAMVGVFPRNKAFNEDCIDLVDEIVWVDGGYLARDERLAEECEVMLTFPATGRELRRSGTWATTRYARNRGREVRVFPLDGTPRWKEPAR